MRIRSQRHCAAGPSARRLISVLAGVQFLVMLTVNVPIAAVPMIEERLRVPAVYSQFIVTTYALVWGALLLFAGRATDLAGRRRILLTGLMLLALGTALSAAAPATSVLMAGRAVQGAGAALAGTAALSLLATTQPVGQQRNRAFALFGAMTAIGSVFGLMLGGALTSLLSWRAIFLPSLLLSVLLAMAAMRMVADDRRLTVWREFDLPAAATVAAGIGLLVLGVSQIERAGAGSPSTIGLLAVSVVLLAIFVLIERRAGDPLLPLTLLTRRSIAAALLSTLLIWAGFASLFFHISFLLQKLLHFTPLQSALAYLPLTVMTAISSRLAVIGAGRPGLVVLAGSAAIAAGSALLSTMRADSGYLTGVLPGLLLAGAGLGLSIVPIQVITFQDTPAGRAGVVSGLLTTSQETASAVGTTILATLAVAVGGTAGIKVALVWGAVAALLGGVLAALLSPRASPSRSA